MIDQNGIVFLLTTLGFGLPVLIFLISKKAMTPFSFRKLTQSFNLALIPQIALAIILAFSMAYLDNNIYTDGLGTNSTDIIMGTGLTYLAIGTFFYLPGLVILNLTNWIRLKIKKPAVNNA